MKFKIMNTNLLRILAALLCGGLPRLVAQSPGSIDTTFNLQLPLSSILSADDFVIQPDGKIVVAGHVFKQTTLADGSVQSDELLGPVFRLLSDGTLDSSFTNHFDATGHTLNGCRFRVSLDSRGRIVLSGNIATIQGVSRPEIARLMPNGVLDLTFDPQWAEWALSGEPSDPMVFNHLVGPGDDILIRVRGATDVLRKLNPDGTLNRGFVPQFDSLGFYPFDIGIQLDGKALATMSVESPTGEQTKVVRFNADGTLDASFASVEADRFLIQPDSRILIMQTEENGTNVFTKLLRLDRNGVPDVSFHEILFKPASIAVMVVDQGGRVLVAGDFSECNGVSCPRIARINSDGTLDLTFQPTAIESASYISAMALQPDGKLVAASREDGSGFIIQRLYGDGLPYVVPTSLCHHADGSVDFQVTAATNRTVVIEASTDLKPNTWTPLARFPAAADRGAMTFTDAEAAQFPRRFYRAVSP